MKKNIIFSSLALALVALMPACSEDYAESSKPHVYGPNENQPIVNVPALTESASGVMDPGQADPEVITVASSEAKYQEAFGASSSDVLSKLGSDYTVCLINQNRGVWDKVAPNSGDKYGWYVNGNGVCCSADDPSAFGKVVYNEAAKAFEFYMAPTASGKTNIEVGVANKDYTKHVRYVFTIAVSDPQHIYINADIPEGDYMTTTVMFADYDSNFQRVLGMTAQEFCQAYTDGTYTLHMVDANNVIDWTSGFTANDGYWCGEAGNVMGWGDGCAFFVEPYAEEIEKDNWFLMGANIGRYPGWNAGTVFNVNFCYGNAAKDKVLYFHVTATLQ